MPELALDDDQRHALARHLHGMGVAQLVRREAPPHAGFPRDASQLRARCGGRPRPPPCRAGDDAEQRSDRQRHPRLQPGLKLLPRPVVHPDLAAPAALATPHQQRPAARVQVGLGERERLADPQAGPPQHDDQAAQPLAVHAVARLAHDGHDLLDRRRVGRVAHPLVARRATRVELRQRGGRATATGGIEQKLGHDPSSGWESPETAPRRERCAGRQTGLPRIRAALRPGELDSRRRTKAAARCPRDYRHRERPSRMEGDSGGAPAAFHGCRERGGGRSRAGDRRVLVRISHLSSPQQRDPVCVELDSAGA